MTMIDVRLPDTKSLKNPFGENRERTVRPYAPLGAIRTNDNDDVLCVEGLSALLPQLGPIIYQFNTKHKCNCVSIDHSAPEGG